MPTPLEPASFELANLDSLRSFAVGAVLAAHLAAMVYSSHGMGAPDIFPGLGRVGVLAFFVHTSLVLMFSLGRMKGQKALRFYVRRAFRIYPLAIVCVLVVLWFRIPAIPLAGSFFQPPPLSRVVKNLLLIQDFEASLSAPMWSLPFEVAMYLTLPILFLIAIKRRGAMFVAVGFVASCCLVAVMFILSNGHTYRLGYVPCFLAGILAFTLRNKLRPRVSSWAWPAFVLIWMFLVATRVFPEWELTSWVVRWMACLILGISIYCFKDSTSKAWNEATHIVATYSYGIYLSHIPAMWLVFRVWNVKNQFAASIESLAITALLSVIAYHLIEAPMIEVGRRIP